MAGPGTGARLAALGIAWLAGVGAQLHERSLHAVGAYVCATLAALAALLFLTARAVRLDRRGPGGERGGRALAGATSSPPSFETSGSVTLLAVAIVAATVAGWGASGWRAALRLADVLPAALEGRDIAVTGVVASLPQRGPNGIRFRFDVESHDALPAALPPTLSLGWYRGFHEDAASVGPQSELRAGQRWRFTVRLRRPHGNLNPHGFDYELLLFEQGVRATGYVRDGPAQLLEQGAGHPVERLRQRVRDAIEAHVDDRRAAGVLAALSIGDQGAIERDDWDLFRATGVAHLMSISGLHVTMLAWLAGLLVAAGWRRSERAMFAVPAPRAARWGGLAFAAAYALFSGWGVPSQRTVWMLAVVTVLPAAGVRWPWPLVLLVAAVVVTALDPWALLQPGFWLSFMAVGLLMASSFARGGDPAEAARATSRDGADARAARAPSRPGDDADRRDGARAWPARVLDASRAGVRSQLIATIGLTPLSLVFFQQVSLVGFAANVVAIPLVTLVITPLALAGAVVPLCWTVGAWVVQGLTAFLGLLGAAPSALWIAPVAPLWAQLAGLLAAVLVISPLPWQARALALPLVVALLVPPRDAPAEGSFELVAADVGQGMAVLVRTRTRLLMYDAGPQYARDSDAGQRVLVPLLRALGLGPIDLLVLSHRDLDHVGGARALLSSIGATAMSSSLEAAHPLLAGAPRSTRCLAGQRWTWDGVDFAVLHPRERDYARAARPNAVSCVLRVSAGGRSALLAGDIEREQESALVVDDAGALRSDVLVVPHHGSRTSSTAAFIDAVRPQVAVVQAGYWNRFGHPAADVVERYRERAVAVVATAGCGAWRWRSDGRQAGECERERGRRYWHHAEDADAP